MRVNEKSPVGRLRTIAARGLLMAISAAGLSRGADPATAAKKIQPETASQHVGETCEVEMEVRSSRRGDKPIFFLNSEKDFSDTNNFTVVILEEDLARFQKSGIEEPAKHFAGKRIRVTGKIEEYRGRPQIRAAEPRQIEIVKPPEPTRPPAKSSTE